MSEFSEKIRNMTSAERREYLKTGTQQTISEAEERTGFIMLTIVILTFYILFKK